MSRRLFGTATLGVAVLAVAGCRVSTMSFGYHEDYHHSRAHVCGYDCHDHYWNGSRVIVLSGGHRHGHDCGHHWDGSYWVTAKRRGVAKVHVGASKMHVGPKKVRVKHVHGDYCGCAFHPKHKRWVTVKKGHRHGPGCGHVRLEGRWSVRF